VEAQATVDKGHRYFDEAADECSIENIVDDNRRRALFSQRTTL